MMPFYQRWIGGNQKNVPLPPAAQDTLGVKADTSALAREVPEEVVPPVVSTVDTSQQEKAPLIQVAGGEEVKTIYIDNQVAKYTWSTADGGNPVLCDLEKYKYYKGGNVNLIQNNYMILSFLNVDGKEFKLNDYNMFADFHNGQTITLSKERPEYDLTFYLPIRNGRIEKILRFYYNSYSFDVIIRFQNLQDYVINRKYFLGWKNGLPPTEENVNDDLNYSRAYTYMAEELINMDASDKFGEKDFNGRVDWAAIRTKYFLVSLLPDNPGMTNGVSISGVKTKVNDRPEKEYNFTIDNQFQPVPLYSDTFMVYLGPLDYYILKKYNVDLQTLVMNRDWYERLFRPISLLIIPAFKFLHRFIPNYGFVIIIFSILIKLVLHPLTKKSYQSMSEMQYLQPKMTEMREKYKDDPQRMNKELMRLYKEHGVNPLGGCLPMLLQMPVLFALFIVFRSTIQLRSQPFILWINDLSAPDTLHLGFSLPLVGNSLHVLPVLMGLTMIWQSKISMTDPKQKFMTYLMPLFMIFIFYSLPSGLNLYYAVFNVLSMAQTYFIKKKMHPGDGDEGKVTAATAPSSGAKTSRGSRKRKK